MELDWASYFTLRNEGVQTAVAAKKCGISASTAYRFESGNKKSSGYKAAQVLGITKVDQQVIPKLLSPEAQKGLDDFAYFRRRYMGRNSSPWQVEAADIIVQLLESGETEDKVVINAPPGSGKSTLFTHDIPIWLICRNRSVRTMVGSRTQKQANKYTRRIRRTLERTTTIRADTNQVVKGWAFDADAVLAKDYGLFYSGRAELWTASEFTVLHEGGVTTDDKEATVTAYGLDTDFLGGRFDFVIWDDVVDRKTTRTADARELFEEKWDTEAETRIEPGGVMVLQGQRIAAEDLYRYVLNKTDENNDPVWRHIKYPAHFDHLCTHTHTRTQAAYPASCLLEPRRISWERLAPIRARQPKLYKVIYQQEDMDVSGVLIDPMWLEGGTDPDTGTEYPGCYDHARKLGDIPAELKTDSGWSVVTVDPSPTLYWSVQHWGLHVATDQRFLLNHHRGMMTTRGLLTMDLDTHVFSGIIHDWWAESCLAGFPITHVIVEQNAAQRFMLQNEVFQRWQETTGVIILPHDTHRNKTDPKYGVESLAEPYSAGKYRLPYTKDIATQGKVQDLVYELTHWVPGGGGASRTDCVMANWFFEYHIHKTWSVPQQGGFDRPQWVREGAARGLTYEATPNGTAKARAALFGRTG